MVQFATRMQGASSNAIREILKVTQRPEVISFAGGLPSPTSFPVDLIREKTDELLRERGRGILQYSTSEGYNPLREAIASHMGEKGVQVTKEDILILSGSQQGIDLVGKTFLDPGDGVIVEEPTYLAALQIFRSYQANFIPVPGDEAGIDLVALEKALQSGKAKLIYLIPTFQNPSGVTYSQERRQRVAQLAEEYNCPVIEDDPYGELRYSGERVPALKAYDQKDNVIYLGSFSKIIAPGLRVGYAVITHPQIRQNVLIGKQGTDVHTSNLSQAIVYEFMQEGYLPGHIEKICADYGAKRDLMLSCLEEYFPKTATWVKPDGGLFIFVKLPEGISTTKVLEKAVNENVAFVPGTSFYPQGGGENTLRLNFSNASFDEIKTGCQRLGQVFQAYLK